MSRDTVNVLTNEDHLRLNVLMSQAEAVRIDESTMRVTGHTDGGERYVQLHPTCPDYRYLQGVRHLLAEIVLGQPWGFPTFIHRWTRSGKLGSVRDQQNLLRLGEPEAVQALAASEDLAPQLYPLVWWSQPSAEIARLLLARSQAVSPDLGRELAGFLVAHLPFETDAVAEMETVSQVLGPGLLDDRTLRSLWSRRERKSPYRVGFLRAAAERLLDPEPPHPLLDELHEVLHLQCRGGNVVAEALRRLLASEGQTFLRETHRALAGSGDQEVFCAAVNRLGSYVGLPGAGAERELEVLQKGSAEQIKSSAAARDLIAAGADLADLEPMVYALLVLAGANERLFYGLFSRTTASGSLLRRKLRPLTEPLLEQIDVLRPRAPAG